jgi:hypothetical protein
MAFRQRGYLLQVAAYQDRIRHGPVTIGERYAALVPDRDDGTDQVLVVTHPSGNAVHDDADTPTRHVPSAFFVSNVCFKSRDS